MASLVDKQGRPLERVKCSKCNKSITTSPKLAKAILDRGCYRCLTKSDKPLVKKIHLKKLSRGYENRSSAWARKKALALDIHDSHLFVHRDDDGLWYVFDRRINQEVTS